MFPFANNKGSAKPKALSSAVYFAIWQAARTQSFMADESKSEVEAIPL